MIYYALKIAVSAFLIVLVSELSKRSTLLGSIFASLAFNLIYRHLLDHLETKDTKQISVLSGDIFWLVLPSLLFFVIFPLLLKRQLNFYLAFGISALVMVAGYFLLTLLLKLK